MTKIRGRRSSQAKTQEDLKEDNLESSKLITAEAKLESIIEPRLDYSDPSSFVTYGSAERYYTAAVDNITNIYPYDGSKYEKTEWHISASGLDNYLFANRYPRTNGSITISHDGWGTTSLSTGSYALPTNKEYITFYGGPHTDASAQNLASLFPSDGGVANVVSEAENRESNLTLGSSNTVEWWMKKDGFVAAGQQEVIFDMWASGSIPAPGDATASIVVETLVDPAGSYPLGISIDTVNRRLYWASSFTNVINSCSFDGDDFGAAVSGLFIPTDTSVAPTLGKLFYLDVNGIHSSSLDGTDDALIVGPSLLGQQITVDETNGYIYAPKNNEQELVRWDLNGDNETILATDAVGFFSEIFVDPVDQKIYWAPINTGGDPAGIYRCDADPATAAATITLLIEGPEPGGAGITDVTLDLTSRKMYYTSTDLAGGPIDVYRANLDGTNARRLFELATSSAGTQDPNLVAGLGYLFATYYTSTGPINTVSKVDLQDTNYGRFAVLINSSSSPLHLTYMSGGYGINASFDGANAPTTASLADGNWHHYAVSIGASPGKADLYVDGKYKDSIIGESINEATGAMIANIGSYYEPRAADDLNISFTGSPIPGWCKLSASLDEFRFWKTARTGEQIGLNWNTQVYGGTNTDTANTDLGVYYKFNEGIVGTSLDATVLDYSGRISNGTWTGYSSGARSLTSAMVESSASLAEFKDPIIYSRNPLVSSLKETLRVEGLIYDQQNNASLYNSIPSWIREEDTGGENTLKLTQIMSSYLDTLQNQLGEINQIKNLGYPSGSEEPYNLIYRNLRNLGFQTQDFFIDATLLERFMDKNNNGNLEFKISEIKNLIYQNIYNNLTYIMTSKGAEKSFRNLVRCFGVDDELVKLNIYANNEIYTLEDRYAESVIKKRMISFNDPTRFEATMFQSASANDTPFWNEYALELSGAGYLPNPTNGGYVDVGTDLDLPPDESFTISMWVKIPVGPNGMSLVSKGDFSGIRQYTLALDLDGKLYGGVGNDHSSATGADLRDGAWHNVVLTNLSTSFFRIYVDGLLVVQHSNGTSTSIKPTVLGTGFNTTVYEDFFEGEMDEVSFWTSFFVADAVTELYNNGVPTDITKHSEASDLVTWLRMGDPNSATGGVGTIIPDQVGSNNGTIEEEGSGGTGEIVALSDSDTIYIRNRTTAGHLGYISSSAAFARMNGLTLEGDIVFPRQKPITEASYFDIPFKQSSLFGMKETDGTDYDWLPVDNADLQVYAMRESKNGESAYFQLTSSQLGINLTSSVFGNVYDNERWILGAKIKNPSIDTDDSYYLEFEGYNSNNGIIQNSFAVSGSLSNTEAWALLDASKRIFAGAYRTNFTGSVVNRSDALVSAVRYWGKHLSADELTAHAIDAKNFGLKDPERPVFNASNDMPAIDTLKLYWDFELVNSSSTQGEFEVLDFSGGSLEKSSLYGDFGNIHDGMGFGFPASSTTVVDVEYINTYTRLNPDVANGSDMVSVLTPSEEIKQELSKPTNLVFSIEKSLYQTISDEMVRFFSTVKDFGSLYNSPPDKYRNTHPELETMRRYFFDKMENSPNVNKFYEYFKWIDDAVVEMLRQVLPAGAELIDGSINIIEGHILERNKYNHKVPVYVVAPIIDLEGALQNPASSVEPEPELGGLPTITDPDTDFDGPPGRPWAPELGSPDDYGTEYIELPEYISSGNANVDSCRLKILNAIVSSPRTVSRLRATEVDSKLYKNQTSNGVVVGSNVSLAASSLSGQYVGNGKIKLFGKVVTSE